MNVLFLGPASSPLVQVIFAAGDNVTTTENEITGDSPELASTDFIVSFGYRHIIGSDVLEKFPGKVINLHISYLPWNRGSDPNFWSFIDNTPKGVTIHLVDEGLDTGPVLVQRLVSMWDSETLATSYDKLQTSIVNLFSDNWYEIKKGYLPACPQKGDGSYHSRRDFKALDFLTKQWGYETPVVDLIRYGAKQRRGGKWANG